MKQVRKAIIPAAGLGTRFLPATKALAKEMLPIVDKPTIQFIVEEARKSGIQDIVVVDGKNKRSIEDHFDSNPELEDNLRDKHKDEMLKLVQETTDINIYFIRQSHPRGLGDAVLTARDFIGDEPFVVMLGDDLNNINNNGTPLTKELIDSYHETQARKSSRGFSTSRALWKSQIQKTRQVIWQSLAVTSLRQKFLTFWLRPSQARVTRFN